MPRGGHRPGAGRPRTATKKAVVREAKREAKAQGLTPLEYMLSVMNDDTAEDERRDRMAQAAAPYVHVKPDGTGGKKDQKQAAAEEVANKFGVRQPPRLVASNS